MSVGNSRLHVGMDVVGLAGGRIGRVAQVRDFDFILEQPGQAPRFVPFIEIEGVEGDTVRLRVRAADVPNRGWAPATNLREEWPGMEPDRSS